MYGVVVCGSAVLVEARPGLANADVDLGGDITDAAKFSAKVEERLDSLVSLAPSLHLDRIRLYIWGAHVHGDGLLFPDDQAKCRSYFAELSPGVLAPSREADEDPAPPLC